MATLLPAKPVSPETAFKVAWTQTYIMNTRFADAGYLACEYKPATDNLRPIFCRDGNTLAYVADYEPEGFVVVSADDDLFPIITYAEYGSFPWQEDSHNVLLNMIRYDLGKRIKLVEVSSPEIISMNNDLWDKLEAGEIQSLTSDESWPAAGETWTGGWVESMWHQSEPFNQFCPTDPLTGYRCIVGCVATAMGQIVAYWQYPPSVTFTTEDNYVTWAREIEIHAPDANFTGIDYRGGSPTNSTCAKISFACGVGSRMDYTSNWSAAYPENSANSFKKHFKYQRADRKLEDDSDFYAVLEENMKAAKPAMLWINETDTASGGHEIVCDGYRIFGHAPEWHLNYGWGVGNPNPLPSSWYFLPYGLPYYPFVIEGVVNIEPGSGIAEDKQPPEDSPSKLTPELKVNAAEIFYHLPEPSRVKIRLFDSAGRCVRVLIDEMQSYGDHTIVWDGKDERGYRLPKGCFFLKLETKSGSRNQRIIIVH